ncbi:uncharacterized protein C6orf132 homolog [Sinocyclocheilus grahami]|uniref:uncharacterized protein C6orf132 homolog n=1 Tax=Sinocyclocheilus grahami TaxID=75366 RepID=UPI0007AC76C0|nr:PREDICTED: uncharacterized protein C6orf132 homolog [Sinocyclocheilus grahami]
MQQPLHQFELNESTRTTAALRPPVLTDGVVQPSSSPPPPPPPPLAAVPSISPFPLILFLLEDGFRPSCRADLLVSHPLSLHPSLKRGQGEQGSQGNIKKESPGKPAGFLDPIPTWKQKPKERRSLPPKQRRRRQPHRQNKTPSLLNPQSPRSRRKMERPTNRGQRSPQEVAAKP